MGKIYDDVHCMYVLLINVNVDRMVKNLIC
jgi:hypothetical protein